MVLNLVVGKVKTRDKTFLAEKFKFIVVPSVCGNESSWNSAKADLWELLVCCWLSWAWQGHREILSDIAVIPAGSCGWTGLPGAQQHLPKLLWASSAFTLPFLMLLKSQECPEATGGGLLETKPWLSYISKTILISSPVGSFAISVFCFSEFLVKIFLFLLLQVPSINEGGEWQQLCFQGWIILIFCLYTYCSVTCRALFWVAGAGVTWGPLQWHKAGCRWQLHSWPWITIVSPYYLQSVWLKCIKVAF